MVTGICVLYPQVLINLERLRHVSFDIELLGYSDGIVGELCRRLGEGWSDGKPTPSPSTCMMCGVEWRSACRGNQIGI